MARLTGLFLRSNSYYVRIVLPFSHPLREKYQSGNLVKSLGVCNHREAVLRGTVLRAEILTTGKASALASPIIDRPTPPAAKVGLETLRDVYNRWVKSKPLSADSIAACGRALRLFEERTQNTPLVKLTREQGDDFRAWLQTLETAPKTARDRLNWIKSLLKYATQELEAIPKNPWSGLEIKSRTTNPRRPWSADHLAKLFSHEIWSQGTLPSNIMAGGKAAYWLPLLGLYTGARCSELCQLNVEDVVIDGRNSILKITDEGADQKIKTEAGIRNVPVHPELVRLGFLEHVRSVGAGNLWPLLPKRQDKAGGLFSNYFGALRRELGIPGSTVFHSFRHTVRTNLSEAGVHEPIIDRLLGHEPGGSVGAKVYTHISVEAIRKAVALLPVHTSALQMISLSDEHTNKSKRKSPP